jgi:hypothetical protein
MLASLLFQPPHWPHLPPNLLKIKTERDKIISAFFINRYAENTILFSHGNAEGRIQERTAPLTLLFCRPGYYLRLVSGFF